MVSEFKIYSFIHNPILTNNDLFASKLNKVDDLIQIKIWI